MKLWKILVPLAVAVLLLAGCAGKPGSQALKMNVGAPEGTVWRTAAETFAQLVQENTGGRWRVDIAYAASEEDRIRTLNRLLDGKADIDLRAVSDLRELEARLSALSLPWLFTDYQDVDGRLFNGSGGEAVRNLIRATGIEPLSLAENGFYQVTNDRRPIAAPADFRWLTIRVGDVAAEAALFTAFGAEPVRMDWGETFPALRDGAVSGQQNTLEAIRAAQVDRVQRYLTVWNCVYDPLCLSVSVTLWEGLSDEDREIFCSAAREACAAEIAASRAQDTEILSRLRNSGVEVTVLSQRQIQAFRAAAEPLYTAWRTDNGDGLLSALGYSG